MILKSKYFWFQGVISWDNFEIKRYQKIYDALSIEKLYRQVFLENYPQKSERGRHEVN